MTKTLFKNTWFISVSLAFGLLLLIAVPIMGEVFLPRWDDSSGCPSRQQIKDDYNHSGMRPNRQITTAENSTIFVSSGLPVLYYSLGSAVGKNVDITVFGDGHSEAIFYFPHSGIYSFSLPQDQLDRMLVNLIDSGFFTTNKGRLEKELRNSPRLSLGTQSLLSSFCFYLDQVGGTGFRGDQDGQIVHINLNNLRDPKVRPSESLPALDQLTSLETLLVNSAKRAADRGMYLEQ